MIETFEQIYPTHIEKRMLDFSHDIMAQTKYDGERTLIHFNHGNVWMTTRRISKKTGKYNEVQTKIRNLPNLDIDYTVIDCETYSNTWNDIVGILHSLQDRAYELQSNVEVKFACFDLVYYNGQSLINVDYGRRFVALTEFLKNVLIPIDNRFHLVRFTKVNSYEEALQFKDKMIEEGYEGCVLKDLSKGYYDKLFTMKMKKIYTVDCVVYDYQKGTGKYSNTIGSLVLGYYDKETDTIKYVSNVNCGTDEERDMWYNNWDKMKNTVLEVKCQEITSKSLRHPVYVRIREDKSYTECTYDTIFSEVEHD